MGTEDVKVEKEHHDFHEEYDDEENNNHDLNETDYMDEGEKNIHDDFHDEEHEEEDEGAEAEGAGRPSWKSTNLLQFWQLDENLKECLSGLTSVEDGTRIRSTKKFRRLLKGQNGAQLVQQYVQASLSCIELEEAWKNGFGKNGFVYVIKLISEALGHFAGKDADDFVNKTEEEQKLWRYVKLRLDKFARSILGSKMNDIYSVLHSYNDKKCQKAVLLLLATIVRRGGSLASDVATSFDFEMKVLANVAQPLATKKRKQKGEEKESSKISKTRRGFVEFALAFLEVSSPSLMRWILQIKPLYSALLRGIGNDEEETIVRILKVLQERVLGAESLVPTGLRSVLFGEAVLEQLSSISADSSLEIASHFAHETLMMVCTDPDHGLLPECPEKQSIAKSGMVIRRGNPARLLKFMLRLRPAEVENHMSLLLAIVSGRPSFVCGYLEKFPYSLEPRSSVSWFRAVSLLCNLIQTANVSPTFLNSVESDGVFLDSHELKNRVKCILPQSFSRVVINRGLLHSDILVKHGSLRVLLEALRSLDSLLKSITSLLENHQRIDSGCEMPTVFIVQSLQSTETNGLDGISKDLIVASPVNAISNGNAFDSCEIFISKLVFLKQQLQDEMRCLMPDPQVLLSLFSSLKVDLAQNKKKLTNSKKQDEAEPKSKRRRVQQNLTKQDIQVFVSGTDFEEMKESGSSFTGLHIDEDSDNDHSNNNDAVILSEIWNTSFRTPDIKEDWDSILHAKILDALTLYQKTLPVSLIENSFDAFKYLPENPLLLSSFQQKSILLLLVECTGGLNLVSPWEGRSGSSVRLYKYLPSLLKLMLCTSDREIQNYAHILSSRAMLSTGAFDRCKEEIEVWFSCLPACCMKDYSYIYSSNSSSLGFGSLASSVISFLCDAVTTVGNNLYKYIDELQTIISKYPFKGGFLRPCYSPLVVCILDKGVRVFESNSKTLRLSQKATISLYVAGVLNFLLQCQDDSKSLAFVIAESISCKKQNLSDTLESFLCEWSPLGELLTLTQNILSSELDASCNLNIEQHYLSNKPVKAHPFSEVMEAMKNIDICKMDGLESAFASSLLCVMPKELLENFPTLLNTGYKYLIGNHSCLRLFFSAYRGLFGQICESWPELLLSGVMLVKSRSCDRQEAMREKNPEHNDGSTDPGTFEFASFLEFESFFTLFTACANSKQSYLLRHPAMKEILEAKIREIPLHSYVNNLKLLMFWIQEFENSAKGEVWFKENIDSCFYLLKELLMHIVRGFKDDGLEKLLLKDIFRSVLAHPAVKTFMSMYSWNSFSSEGNEVKKAFYKNLRQSSDDEKFEVFVHYCQVGLHPFDNNIVSILRGLIDNAVSSINFKQSEASNKQRVLVKIITDFCNPFISKLLLTMKKQISQSMEEDPNGMLPSPTIYIFSLLSSFVSPFSLIELVQCLFSNMNHGVAKDSKAVKRLSYSDIGLYFVKKSFEMLSAYFNNNEDNNDLQVLFWNMDNKRFDRAQLVEVYMKVIELVMRHPSKSADMCLISILKVINMTKGAKVLPHTLPLSKMLAQLISFTPAELLKYCFETVDPLKARILSLISESNSLYSTVSDVALVSIGMPLVQKLDLTNCLIYSKKYSWSDFSHRLLEEDIIFVLPITLKFFLFDQRVHMLPLECLTKVSNSYLDILYRGFKKWNSFAFSKRLEILELDEALWMEGKDLSTYFSKSLLGLAVSMFQVSGNLQQISKKKRKKLLSSLLLEKDSILDPKIKDINSHSFETLLNVVNRVCAKVTLAEWLLFRNASSLNVSGRKVSDDNLKCRYENEVSNSDECKLEPHDYIMFIESLICSLNAMYQQHQIADETYLESSSKKKFILIIFMEKILQHCLLNLAIELSVHSVEGPYIFSIKSFVKSVFLYRFEDFSAMRTVRGLILVLLKSTCGSDSSSQFATEALNFLIGHSKFVSTILWTSTSSQKTFNHSDKGTMFKPLTTVVGFHKRVLSFHNEENKGNNLVGDDSDDFGKLWEKSNSKTRESFILHEKKKSEVVKLLRTMYLLKSNKESSVVTKTSINVKELFCLLLAGYGATMATSDIEILTLLHEIESLEKPNIVSLHQMNYLYGEAMLKKRKAQQDEKLFSEFSANDNESGERGKQNFRETLMIDPEICAETILRFPFERKSWEGAVDAVNFAEERLTEIHMGKEDEKSLHSNSFICYDPLFFLEFSSYVLKTGYVESSDFVRLGLLPLALVCISSSAEDIRKLAYDVLGRYMKELEIGQNFKERARILLLLTFVKNAILEPWQKVPSVLSIFSAEASLILMDPTNSFYPAVNRLLMRSPSMDLESIPLFHSMFGNGSVHFKKDRIWILRLLVTGLNTPEDIPLYRRRFLLEFLSSFYGSSIADADTKLLVLQVVQKAVNQRALAQYLVEKAGLLVWLSSIISHSSQEKLKSYKSSEPLGISIVLQVICKLLSWRSIVSWLHKNGFEQLTQVASQLQLLFEPDSSKLVGNHSILKSILQILIATVHLSQQRKFYQPRYSFDLEGLYRVIGIIEIEDSDMNSKILIELGLKLFLSVSPVTATTAEDKWKLVNLGKWAVSRILRLRSFSDVGAGTNSHKNWNLLSNDIHEETMMEKLLRWLTSSIILCLYSSIMKNGKDLFPQEISNMDNLLTFLKYVKNLKCLTAFFSHQEANRELAQLLLYIFNFVTPSCKSLSSVVSALGVLVLADATDVLDGSSSNGGSSSFLTPMLAEISCPDEANPLWRWSFKNAWKNPLSEKSNAQKLYENEVCQILLLFFSKYLAGSILHLECKFLWQNVNISSPSDYTKFELGEKLKTLKREIYDMSSK